MPIRWETNEAVWTALLGVRSWLVGDFVDRWEHAARITAEDTRPLTDAWERLHAGEFELYEDFFKRSRSAISSLHERLSDCIETIHQEIAARHAGDDAGRRRHHEAAARKFDALVAGYAAELHAIKGLLEIHLREQPGISMPSLRSVRGGIIIGSPYSRQTGTHVSSSIEHSPGAVANVGHNLSSLTTSVRNTLARSAQPEEIKALLERLAAQIADLGAARAPAAGQLALDCRTLAEELAQPEPRRKWWQLSLEGLKEAAEALGEVGVPIVRTAKKLAALLG